MYPIYFWIENADANTNNECGTFLWKKQHFVNLSKAVYKQVSSPSVSIQTITLSEFMVDSCWDFNYSASVRCHIYKVLSILVCHRPNRLRGNGFCQYQFGCRNSGSYRLFAKQIYACDSDGNEKYVWCFRIQLTKVNRKSQNQLELTYQATHMYFVVAFEAIWLMGEWTISSLVSHCVFNMWKHISAHSLT